ncbi:MAG: hypothetical protein JNK46_09465 [Methylobacteriaceae bacterium]|nr:hypothetical protein [Methylobacteriaceae bacterium]
MTARPDRRAALAEVERQARIAATALNAMREAIAQLRAADNTTDAETPGKLRPIAEAARIARVSVDTARRRAK